MDYKSHVLVIIQRLRVRSTVFVRFHSIDYPAENTKQCWVVCRRRWSQTLCRYSFPRTVVRPPWTGYEVVNDSWWPLASGSPCTICGTTSTWSLSKCTKRCSYAAQMYLCALMSQMCLVWRRRVSQARVNKGPQDGTVNTRFDIWYSTRHTQFWALTNT